MEQAVWNKQYGTSSMEQAVWNKQYGTSSMEQAVWNKQYGTSSMEQAVWNKQYGTSSMEQAVWNKQYGTSSMVSPYCVFLQRFNKYFVIGYNCACWFFIENIIMHFTLRMHNNNSYNPFLTRSYTRTEVTLIYFKVYKCFDIKLR